MEKNTEVKVQESQPTTRDTIRAAFDEHKEKIAKAEAEEKQEKTEVVEQPVEKVEQSKKIEPEKKEEVKDTPSEKKEEVQEVSSEKKEEKEEKVEPKEPEKKAKVPFGISKEIRAEWDNLSPNVQTYLSKVVKENLDTKANEGRRTHMRDVEQVLTPYMPEIQKLGVSPAQLVKRLLDYTDLLASPQHKYAAIQSLATNYGIDLSVFTENQDQNQNNPQQNNRTQEQLDPDYIPPAIDSKLNTILDRFNQLDNTQKSNNDKAAAEYINTWAGFNPGTSEYGNKPYFPYVRQTMFNLISSGAVPLVNGQIDLDSAYDLACYANPEIRSLIEEDNLKEIAAKQQLNKQSQQQVVQKAKNLGSSIRSGAPVPGGKQQDQPKTMNGKPLTVRDSIRMAMQQMRNA